MSTQRERTTRATSLETSAASKRARTASSSSAGATLTVGAICGADADVGVGARAATVRAVVARAFLALGGEDGVAAMLRPLAAVASAALLREYVRFLAMKAVLGDVDAPPLLSPSGPVDAVWHAHMLEPQSYVRFCAALLGDDALGRVFYHSPTTAEDAARAARYDRTRTLYALHYGVRGAPMHWPDEVDDADAPERDAKRPSSSAAARAAVVVGNESDSDGDDDDSEDDTVSDAEDEPTSPSPSPSNEDGRLHCQTMTGKTISMAYPGQFTTIRTIMAMYARSEGIPVDQQRLLHEGRVLDESKTLAVYGIPRNATLFMVLKLRGC